MIKILVKISLATAGIILLYEISNLLFFYHYFKFEYYIAGVAIAALFAGIIITKKYASTPNKKSFTADLTNKELQILEQIYAGKTNKEIAAINFVEVSTVKTHINNIYGKLGVNNRRSAAEAYQQYVYQQKSTLSPPSAI